MMKSVSELALDGYYTMRNDRKGRRGRGCLIHCKKELIEESQDELTTIKDIEAVWCRVGKLVCGVSREGQQKW